MRILIAVFMLCLAVVTVDDGAAAQSPNATAGEPLESYVALVEELGLRRVNVLFPNPQSIFDGYHLGFVNVGTGI